MVTARHSTNGRPGEQQRDVGLQAKCRMSRRPWTFRSGACQTEAAVITSCRSGSGSRTRLTCVVLLSLTVSMSVSCINGTSRMDASLFAAVENGDAASLTALLTHGANANATNNQGRTPLMIASASGHHNLIPVLVKAGADPNARVVLSHAYLAGQIIFGPHDRPNTEDQERTALMLAVTHEQLPSVNAMIAAGASLDARDQRGNTALGLAASGDSTNILQTLLVAGASPDIGDVQGFTPLMKAQNPTVIKALCDAGANANATNSFGETPLMFAVRAGDVEAVSVLLAFGANPNATNRLDGESPLGYAVKSSRSDIIKLLRGGTR